VTARCITLELMETKSARKIKCTDNRWENIRWVQQTQQFNNKKNLNS